MEVKVNNTYVLTLSELEFSTLHKFIGRTSKTDRRSIANLSDEENDVISELYANINEEQNNDQEKN